MIMVENCTQVTVDTHVCVFQGCLLAVIVTHHLCSISVMFSASLIMHMCFAAMATQVTLVTAL